ncbi:MAG: hypothetical protein Q7U92_26720 [Bradyrhizobium sp.]|nr:hypothetical protein [Bradyrhizobium sp.]
MTLDQFRKLAEIWGGDIDRWPAAMQDAARAMAGGGETSRILAEQLRLDRLLSAAPDVTDDRAGRIGFAVLQRLATPDRDPPWFRRLLRPASFVPAASLACSAMMGLWLAGALPYHQQDQALSVVSMVFDSSAVTLWGLQ